MKKTIYKFSLILTLLFISSGYSQNPPVLRQVSTTTAQNRTNYTLKTGDYIKDTYNHLDKYIGTWQYQSGNTIFTLKLEKVNKYLFNMDGFYFYDDLIIVTYKLVKNEVTIHNNLGHSQVIGQQDLRGRLSNLDNFNYINGVFHDFTTNVFVNRCEIKLLTPYPAQPGAQQKIFFKMFENHTKRMNEGEGNTTALFSMPNEIELIKQP